MEAATLIDSPAKAVGTVPRRRGSLIIEEYCPPPPLVHAPRKEAVPLISPSVRERGTRLGLGLLVLCMHLPLAWFAAHPGIAWIGAASPVVPLTIYSIAPTPHNRVSTDVTIEPPSLLDIHIQRPVLSNLDIPETAESIAQSGGSTIPPRPADPARNSQSFAQQAGLTPGTGVTVVLRVEVLGSGAVGQVLVDVSGGSRGIDAAAIDYVRSLKWIGGRIGDLPATIWIRWGVRLDG